MRGRGVILLCGLLLALAECGTDCALAQEPPLGTLPPTIPAAPTERLAVLQPAATDSDLPPWAQHGGEAEGHLGRLRRWLAWELEEEETRPRGWVTTEYLFAWIRSDKTPPLLTTGLTTDATPGALLLPYTKGIYGGDINFEDRQGLRITVGANLSDEWSIDANYFFLDGRHPLYFASSPGTPVLARPFFNVNTGLQDSSLTTYPGLLQGTISIDSYSFMEGTELNGRFDLWTSENIRVRGIAGLRWLNLREGLAIEEFTQITMPGPLNGLPLGDEDLFRTRNDFLGGQLGIETEFRYQRWTLDLYGKCAIGDMRQDVRIQGATDLFGAVVPGGLFAVSSNVGNYARDRFGIVPEAGVKLEAELCRHVSVFAGYTFLYMNDVARPGSQVDTAVNVNLVPTSATFGTGANPARPAFGFKETDFWVHMFQGGVTIRW
jgi:hypothetical protein